MRKNLNEAQDYGQEALVWIGRAKRVGNEKFDHEACYNAIAAFRRARHFVELTAQVAEALK
ncbi:MAG: hypothetical protein ACHQX3_00555 [Nitrospirales bacterium]